MIEYVRLHAVTIRRFVLTVLTLMPPRVTDVFRSVGAAVVFTVAAGLSCAAEMSSAQLQELLEHNRRLQEQVRAQQATIDALNTRMGELQKATERHDRELRGLQDRVESPAVAVPRSTRDGEVRISAEAGIAFFKTGRLGRFPKSEFRIDDAFVSLEAPVRKNIYFFTELKLLTREANDEIFELGEIYLDFENVSAAWGQPGLLNVRFGRMWIPFGEEYLQRGPVANPLISHSLADLWGVDEGIEIYGRLGPAQYVLAVQNGGNSRLRDFNADKSVAGRVSFQPAKWLHVSGSAMRTGEIASVADNLTELWFANGFFRSLGPTARTGTFWANLYQVDATARWGTGHLGLALGRAKYDDSDTLVDNTRHFRFGSAEAVQTLSGALYAAVRYSAIRVANGYPMGGLAPLGPYFFRPGVLTDELKRTSIGLGYRFGPPLVLKFEYTWESGRLSTGVKRDVGDFFGTELGVKF